MEKYFDAQQESEEVKLLFRKHWFTLAVPLFLVFILYLIGFVLLFIPVLVPEITSGYAYNFYVLTLSLLFLIATNISFSVILLYYLNVGIITDMHIVEIVQERLFSRKVSQMELGKIQDVSSKQSGIAQTILNFGEVDIQTAGELPNIFFKKVPKPQELTEKIITLADNYSKKHGIRSEEGDVNPNIVKKNIEKLDGSVEKKPE